MDVYITFTKDTLCILRGYEEYGKMKRGQKRKNLVSFTVSGYDEYPIDSIEEMYVDRYANSARLMIKDKSGKEFPIARFSLGFADKFEKFSQRVNCTAKNEPIDDRLLEGVKTHCPTCGEPYPDPNRPVCPRCVDRRSVFKRLLSMFGEFKGAVFLILLTIVLSNVFAVLSPIFGSQMLYDDVLAENGKYYGKILMVVMLIVGINIAGMIMRIISGIITSKVVPVVTHRLRVKIFSSMQRLPLNFSQANRQARLCPGSTEIVRTSTGFSRI